MRSRVALLLLAIATCRPAFAAGASEMWNCDLGSGPGNMIVLVNRGAGSYVKISGQRAPATYTEEDGTRRWAWGQNAIVLDDEGLAQYFEGGNTDTAKVSFRCRPMD